MASPIDERAGAGLPANAADLVALGQPVVLRGLAAGWPIVRAGDPAAYLRRFAGDTPVDVAVGAPEFGGRLFYTADLAGLNFVKERSTVGAVLDRLAAAADAARPPAIAAQAVAVREALPGFAEENRLTLFDRDLAPRIWIGNRVVVATHHDMASNVAVVAAGRRRFTLFPPDQVGNLHIGPLEFTPAGTPVSLVDLDAPDLDRFPRFAEALRHARTAELAPGDAIYIPHMWWHHVRSLDPLSVLVNYWWSEAAAPQPGLAPVDAMIHALLAFDGLPDEQRAAWRAMFDQLVFDDDPDALAAVPPERRGIRGALDENAKARLRRQLGRMMAS